MPASRLGARILACTAVTGLAVASATPASFAAPVPGIAPPPSFSPVATTTQVDAPVPELDWDTCDDDEDETDSGELAGFLCATAEVPTDYNDPHGSTTTIHLTKLPATGAKTRIGTLFTNPGGPGDSGVDFVHQVGRNVYTEDVRAHFDILGFDPRAVGRSDPATCYPTQDDEAAALATQLHFPANDADERTYVRDTIRMATLCRMTSRERFEHSSTANVARDMDLLRQALGEDQLTYVGYSYGSYLGATYARLFPERVRALAVDGTIVPEDYAGRPGAEDRSTPERMGQGAGAAEAFAEFLRLCTEAGSQNCALAGLGDPETVVEDTFTRLKSTPIDMELPGVGPVEFTYPAVVAQTYTSLYHPGSWSQLADLIAQLAAGDTELTGEAASLVEQSTHGAPQRQRRGEDYPSVGGTLASGCVDTGTTGDPRGFAERADAADEEAPHFGRYRAWLALACEYLRVTDDDAYLGPWDQQVEAPVLVIGTRFDPATPYAGTQPYADHFRNSRVLTVEGWGHTTLGKSSCADGVLARYLVDLTVPDHGATCHQDVQPFGMKSTYDDGWHGPDDGWLSSRDGWHGPAHDSPPATGQ
ncbi:alpha/beta hydrolase [Phytoactinopolyspora mesophila]|uniref:Alpha/beta fold hydrolase n=1 Tax=Phytoactinopolyspora mesophila TaxID=2650750 RepID=A0A7K3M322_9ACTN|nr:alpha/beta hydrolase [Phytoactinopolyspora mesophila]NDL56848.1 alpha/beta fold hydrolase [Phytoactinopolyspora mesophila]